MSRALDLSSIMTFRNDFTLFSVALRSLRSLQSVQRLSSYDESLESSSNHSVLCF